MSEQTPDELDPDEPVDATAADLKDPPEGAAPDDPVNGVAPADLKDDVVVVDNPEAEKPKRKSRRAKAEEEPPADTGHVAVNDEFGNVKTPNDDVPKQPPSVPSDDPLRSRVPGESYEDYLVRCDAYGANALDEPEWATL